MKHLVFALLVLIAASPVAAQGIYPQIPPPDIARAPLLKPGQVLKPGDVFRDCAACPDMVVLPPGLFVMGNAKRKDESPTRIIRFKKPFAIGRFELTHDEWQACFDAGGCSEKPGDHDWGRHRMPVINVSHTQANRYANWLTRQTGKTYRLPSEAEWEYAARAGSKTNYWFGELVGDGKVNCRECGSPWSGIGNAPVGSLPPNPWGVYEMHGNAFEWVQDCWHPDYAGAPKDASPWVEEGCQMRVIRGGSWYYYSRMSRSANRQKNGAAVKSYWLGFRVVRELP